MTHTINVTSGCGDHGKDGIKVFEEHHICGPVCTAMGFNDEVENTNDEDDELAKDQEKTRLHPKPAPRTRPCFDPIHD
ncbi:hypothetical protein BT96DRAFT_1007722 [Gymnopus androsaceus JB14]|uniref:Alpha-type protein kinase domain-containing protein n=1 Tax=Gymnopus androsaceus JB14 TaxID=1447944 RepID=A0A6A4GHE1_9AGAR|nr:hypothetical protein BT96DRAFT_1007722 [Gymnopus androsaceus JB14]